MSLLTTTIIVVIGYEFDWSSRCSRISFLSTAVQVYHSAALSTSPRLAVPSFTTDVCAFDAEILRAAENFVHGACKYLVQEDGVLTKRLAQHTHIINQMMAKECPLLS